jgi:hypothetical protein
MINLTATYESIAIRGDQIPSREDAFPRSSLPPARIEPRVDMQKARPPIPGKRRRREKIILKSLTTPSKV